MDESKQSNESIVDTRQTRIREAISSADTQSIIHAHKKEIKKKPFQLSWKAPGKNEAHPLLCDLFRIFLTFDQKQKYVEASGHVPPVPLVDQEFLCEGQAFVAAGLRGSSLIPTESNG